MMNASRKFIEIISSNLRIGLTGLIRPNRKKSLGGGSVLELGVYPIQFCQFIFREEPKSIKATGILNDDGIDLEMKAELNYGGNKIGKISSSGLVDPNNTATIIGTKGTMTVNSHITINYVESECSGNLYS